MPFILHEEAFASLFLKKNEFTFVDPTKVIQSLDKIIMLKLAMAKLNQSIVVGVEFLCQ